MTTKVYVLYGLGGRTWSSGMESLEVKFRKAGFDTGKKVWQWGDWKAIVEDIKKIGPNVPVIIAGHSMGANAASWIAASLPNRNIKYIFGYDPTIWSPVTAFNSNVENAYCFHGINWLNPVGHALYSKLDNNKKTTIKTISTSIIHSLIDDNTKFHDLVVSETKRVLGIK